MGIIGRILLFSAAVAGHAGPASARDALGIFGRWGAFRDPRPPRCFAISEPLSSFRDAKFRPFATVATWPAPNVRGQVHIRLRKAKLPQAPVTLTVGDRDFPMVGGDADVWAPNARADAAIVAAMRSASSMRISTRGETGRTFADHYALKGAATAIDAAALGCARVR
jgi:hypothetical protein